MRRLKNYMRQFNTLKKIYHQTRKGPVRNIRDLIWVLHQKFRYLLLKTKNSAQLSEISEKLSEKNYADGSVIVITFGSRWFGNSDNQLADFLDTYIATTRVPSRVEMLIKIDADDDLNYFMGIKEKYCALVNLRFFTTPRGRGYEDMHIWHHDLIRNRNLAAKVHYILTDDAKFECKNWDDELINIIEKRKDTFFIGTACSLEEATTYYGPNPIEPVPVYWIRGDDYPIYGFDLLTSIAGKAKDYPDWNEFGNLQLVDQYAGALLEVAWKQFGVNLHEQINLYAARGGGNFCWSQSPTRTEIRTRTLTKFFDELSRTQRKEIIEHVLSDMRSLH